MRTLRLMADYDCFPLWVPSESRVENPDPRSLPLSPGLVERLAAWASRFDAILDRKDPASSRFPSGVEEDRFNADGLRLAEALATELSGAYEVIYKDTHGASVVIDPDRASNRGAPRAPQLPAPRIVAGPVRSPAEAQQLRRLGTDTITLLTSSHPFFGHDRVVSTSEAQAIASCFGGRSGLLVPPSLDLEDLEQQLAAGWVELIEIDVRFPVTAEVLALARRHELEVVVSGITVDYDDDDQWLRETLEHTTQQLGPAVFVVTAVPSLRDPIHWFMVEAGRHEEDLTRARVRSILDAHPVLINLGHVERPPEVVRDLFPEARGVYVYLGTPRSDGSNPALDHDWARSPPDD